MAKQRALFLDKDGTLVVDVPYNVDPGRIVLAPGVGSGLQRLALAGFRLIVISNQAGVAHGYFDEQALRAAFDRLAEMLGEFNVRLDGFYYCPHHPQGIVSRYAAVCQCRKPLPGLVLQAAQEHQIDLAQSWFVGDTLDDIQAGHRAGCRGVLIDNGNETLWELTEERLPDYRAADMDDAAQWILQAGSSTAELSRDQRGHSESEDRRAYESC